jgi:hypothetical protein
MSMKQKHQHHKSMHSVLRQLMMLFSLSVVIATRAVAAEATPWAGGSVCGGGNFTISGDGFGPINHGAANCWSVYLKQLGKQEFEAGATFGVTLTVTAPQQANFYSVALDLGLQSCWDALVNGTNVGGYCQYENVQVNTFSFSAVVNPKDLLFSPDTPPSNGRVTLRPGQSHAFFSTPGVSPSSLTWAIYGDPQTANVNASGVVTAGTKPGSVRVRGTNGSGKCYDLIVDVVDCDEGCKSGPTCAHPVSKLGSVDVRVPLGWARGGNSAQFMHINADLPSTNLATPRGLEYNFIRGGVEKITNTAGLRQVRMVEGLANVATNSPYKYTIGFYAVSNILAKDASGFYGVTNSPHTTVIVENPGNDTNKLRVTYTRDGHDTIYDYSWAD